MVEDVKLRACLTLRPRAVLESDPDFPKRAPRRVAKEDVAAALDRVEPRWRWLYVLYPTESSLRDRGE